MRKTRGLLWIGLVFAWGALSTLTWGGLLRTPLVVPFAVTTWPPHEVLNVFYGHGLGANVRVPLAPVSVFAYLVWSAVLWSPLLLLTWKKVPSWLTVTAQIAFLSAIAASFWRYGNG